MQRFCIIVEWDIAILGGVSAHPESETDSLRTESEPEGSRYRPDWFGRGWKNWAWTVPEMFVGYSIFGGGEIEHRK